MILRVFILLFGFGLVSSLQATRMGNSSLQRGVGVGMSWTTTVSSSTYQLSHLPENIFCCVSYVSFIIGNANIRVQDQRHSRPNTDDKITSNRLTQCLGWQSNCCSKGETCVWIPRTKIKVVDAVLFCYSCTLRQDGW